MPKKKNDYDTYEKNHRTDKCFSDREKMIESLSKVMAAQVSKTRKLPFDIKNVRLMAAQIREICILDTMKDDEIREALRDADAAKRLMHNTRDRLYKVPGESVKNLCESMKKLYGNMVNDDGHSREFQKLSENIKKLGETDEKTKDMTPNKREKEIMKAVVNVVQSAVKYMDGKEKVRNTTEDEACFNNALDVLSELTKHIPGIKSRTDAIIDKINSYRSKDKINKEDFTEKYGAQYIRLAEKANRNVQLTDSEEKPVEEDQNINNEINEINEIKIAEPENIVMPIRGKADKRKEQYESLNSQGAAALANEIQRMKDAKEVLDLEKTNNLIRLYINMGNEMQAEYIKIKDDKNKTMLYDKLAKVFTKDYTALLKYKKHLESLAKLDEKKSSKSKKNISIDPNKTNYLDIESFYESTRTRTITVSEEEMEKLEVATNSSNIRYKVPFIVEDEPIEGKKKGDSCIGYFTKAESYDTDDKDTIMELKAKAKRKLLAKKYPEAADFLEEIEYKKFIQMKYSTDEADALNAFTVLTDKPYQFGLNRNRDKSKTYILEWMNKSEASDEDKDRCKEDLDRMDSDQKFMAYVEYMNYLLEVEGALTVREVNGIKFGVDTSERNALTSVFADILGCSQNIAFSEKMKIKTKKDGKDVVIKGVVMMPAKGLDILKEGIGSPLANMDGMSFEKSPGLVKNIASIQFLDYIIRNPDRFAYNVFFNLNKDSKLTEVQGIDNDTTFTAIDNRNLLSWSKLGVIPKSMADTIKATDTNMLSILMRGYGLSDVEIEKVVEGVNTAKEKIAYSEQRYAGKDPRYIEFGVPRILPDKDLDKLSINGQLVRQHGLFERLMEQGDKEIQRGDLYDNDYDKCGILAKENIEVYLSALKYGMNEINNNNAENLKFREEGAEILNDKYNAMKTEYQKIDVMYETEVPGFRFISTSMEHSNFVFNYHNKYKDLKETVSNALEKTEEFISAMTEDIYENGGKYEEYQTLKAERDYYKKEYSKDGEISAENIQNLKDMDEEIKTLEDTPEIKAINAAIKNRESLQKMVDNFNKVETLTKKLKGEVKKLDKFRDAVMDNHKLANSYEGSSLEKENNKMNKRFDEMYDEIKIFQRQRGIK